MENGLEKNKTKINS